MIPKIRVWAQGWEEMYYPEIFSVGPDTVSLQTEEGLFTFEKKYAMLATGLTDINGVEDYVGDIWRVFIKKIPYYFVRNLEIDWNGFRVSFDCISPAHMSPVHANVDEQGEIIGNICQGSSMDEDVMEIYKAWKETHDDS